jgi:hypothetical protein
MRGETPKRTWPRNVLKFREPPATDKPPPHPKQSIGTAEPNALLDRSFIDVRCLSQRSTLPTPQYQTSGTTGTTNRKSDVERRAKLSGRSIGPLPHCNNINGRIHHSIDCPLFSTRSIIGAASERTHGSYCFFQRCATMVVVLLVQNGLWATLGLVSE